MRRQRFAARFFGLSFIAILTLAASAQWMPLDSGVPAFFEAIPAAKNQHPILNGDALQGEYFTHRYQTVAYQMASEASGVIYQMPCYCWCSRALGHKSLHSCFEGTHGAVCTVCMREAVYAYRQNRAGQTPQQIRQGIIRGDWREVDLPSIRLE